MHAFPNGRWSSHPTYQQLEQSAEQFDNQSDSRASRPHITPALKVSDLSSAHLHVIPGEARAGGGGEAGEAGCRLIANDYSVETQHETEALCTVREKAPLTAGKDRQQFEASGGVESVDTQRESETGASSLRQKSESPDWRTGPLASSFSLADQAACSMAIREQISLMRRGDKFHFIALATNLIQVLENERNAVVDRIAEMED